MVIIYQLSRKRVARWLESLAERSGLSVFEVRWRIDAAVESVRLHKDCVMLSNLTTQKLGGSSHQREFARCECCRSFVNLVWLCSASSASELKEIAGNRANLLFLGLRVVENKLLGATDDGEKSSAAEKSESPEELQCWGAELFHEKPEESSSSPYASVGIYDPREDDDGYGDAAYKEIPCFGFEELLRFDRLPLPRRYYVRECAECRTVVRNMKKIRVAVGTLDMRCAVIRAAHARGKAARTRQKK